MTLLIIPLINVFYSMILAPTSYALLIAPSLISANPLPSTPLHQSLPSLHHCLQQALQYPILQIITTYAVS